MGKLCCSGKESDLSRGPNKTKDVDDDMIETISSLTSHMNVNDSLHLEHA